jgi:hypothetical protein
MTFGSAPLPDVHLGYTLTRCQGEGLIFVRIGLIFLFLDTLYRRS